MVFCLSNPSALVAKGSSKCALSLLRLGRHIGCCDPFTCLCGHCSALYSCLCCRWFHAWSFQTMYSNTVSLFPQTHRAVLCVYAAICGSNLRGRRCGRRCEQVRCLADKPWHDWALACTMRVVVVTQLRLSVVLVPQVCCEGVPHCLVSASCMLMLVEPRRCCQVKRLLLSVVPSGSLADLTEARCWQV